MLQRIIFFLIFAALVHTINDLKTEGYEKVFSRNGRYVRTYTSRLRSSREFELWR
jgi:hypothetical protein